MSDTLSAYVTIIMSMLVLLCVLLYTRQRLGALHQYSAYSLTGFDIISGSMYAMGMLTVPLCYVLEVPSHLAMLIGWGIIFLPPCITYVFLYLAVPRTLPLIRWLITERFHLGSKA